MDRAHNSMTEWLHNEWMSTGLEPVRLSLASSQESCAGGNLGSALREPEQARRLAWGRLGQKLFLDVAMGLAWLHEMQVGLHRPVIWS